MIKFVGLRAKAYSYLIDYGSEDKKAKCTKMFVIKRKLKFKILNCLEATQLENKVNYLENKIDIDSINENHEEFIKNYKLRSKIQKRFKSQRHMFPLKK